MLDAVTLDQLRTFIAAAEQGSFSAAGRKLRRAQSVVSQTLANLEGQLGVTLFDRSVRYPTLTEDGRALLQNARAVADEMDSFKARAKTLREGLEPELSLSIDVMFPMSELTAPLPRFAILFRTRRCGCPSKRSVGSSNRCYRVRARSASLARYPLCPRHA